MIDTARPAISAFDFVVSRSGISASDQAVAQQFLAAFDFVSARVGDCCV
jgi:hypothetical protein